MSSIESPNFLVTLRNEAKNAQPGILPLNTKFESYIGHTVINISNITLDQYQIRTLEKVLTFCPTPGPPDKSQIWLDFKEFHRRLELMEFFSRDDIDQKKDDTNINQSIIDFMNQNAQSDDPSTPDEESLNKEIQAKFKPKSEWRPYPPNRTLDIFQRSIKRKFLNANLSIKDMTTLLKKKGLA